LIQVAPVGELKKQVGSVVLDEATIVSDNILVLVRLEVAEGL
jgi:hypothetical protein